MPEHKTRRQREKEQRLEELVAAASRLFAQNGFSDVSLDDIGAEVGITGQGIYRYFRSKQDLLTHILFKASDSLLIDSKQIRSTTPVDRQRLQKLVDLHTDFALTNPEVIRIQSRELDRVRENEQRQVRRMQREYIDIWMNAISGIHPDEEVRELRVRAQAMIELINSTSYSLMNPAAPNLPMATENVRHLVSAMAMGAAEAKQ